MCEKCENYPQAVRSLSCKALIVHTKCAETAKCDNYPQVAGSPCRMEHKEVAVTHSQLPSNLILVFITTYICPHIIIVINRLKPAYGRQGLAGQWGQDTDLADTF